MKALIAMSGGVDSSVAAKQMQAEGFDCIGCTMRLFENDVIGQDLLASCCSLENTRDAKSVCDTLGIPHHIFHFENLFRESVILPFIEAYAKGRTPNPCIACNRSLKWHHLFDKMQSLGCDLLVTGHYARIGRDEKSGRYLLKKAVDHSKDQSYVLYMMTQEQLSCTRFPLGEQAKSETRAEAVDAGFQNAKKHDSQDICFVPDGDYAAFIERYSGQVYPPGDFIDSDGNVLGRHKGIIHYTIGQRRGLGIPAAHRYYVVSIDSDANTVTLGLDDDLFSTTLIADQINLISVPKIEGEMRLLAKIRYRHKEQPASVTQISDDEIRVVFDEPQRAITAGQAVVLYDGDVVVGGGTIRAASDK